MKLGCRPHPGRYAVTTGNCGLHKGEEDRVPVYPADNFRYLDASRLRLFEIPYVGL